MKRFACWGGGLLLLAVTAGCPKETELGGPGAEDGEAVDSEKTFSLSLPDGTNVTKGEDEEATISLNAGDEFMEQVTLTLKPPAGVTIEPSERTLLGENDDGKVMIRAGQAAEAGDLVVKVVGKAPTGEPVNSEFTVTVSAADEDAGDTATGDGTTDDLAPPADARPEEAEGT